ncbi:Serine/threonine-protein kinase [Linderina macrospora]|uniref:Serine/threonine-protein kinase n=1 Tax=Linderina macrospora TaxID=4868 RepID=A0ACC1JGZ8_9FUNG|nr:Serine/threonine-protein kinase [Linderina macrospora]
MGQAASHALVAAADLQPPLAMGVSSLEAELGENLQHVRMLGSTRFMKTIQCLHPREGRLALHVFMRPVSISFDLAPYIASLRNTYDKLSGTDHILSNVTVVSDERAVYMLRQYLHNNLYDRVSTRPFLSGTEKRWIAHQILVALREAHARGVVHGDVKSENVVVTSWNLAYLADFAPFKPTYLPADDPAEFNFYFDTAARQCCCVAPERFYDARSEITKLLANPSEDALGVLALQPAMDVFSAGCVIAELFLDGNPLFSLSRLLKYRNGELQPEELVAGISDAEIAELVLHMVQIDPDARLSAAEYLDRWAAVFPRAPMAAYMDQADADLRMRALYQEVDEITDDTCEITASVACANIRNCQKPSTRCLGIKILQKCSHGPMKGDADHILPYLVTLAQDPSPQVRMEAVYAMHTLLRDLDKLTPINANLFDDYLAPQLVYVADDKSANVRCMLASVLGDLADTAFCLLGAPPRTDFIGGQLRSIVGKLSFDDAEVKHVLLCAFPQLYERGIQSLSHIITYLNDRDCWFLRAAFFDVVFAAAAQISRHAAREYIVPLVNLADSEVFVVISALRTLVRLMPQLSPAMLWDKLVEVGTFCMDVPALRPGAKELVDLAVRRARLPVAKDVAMMALEIAKTSNATSGKRKPYSNPRRNGSADSVERLVNVRDIGAKVRTMFLKPVSDPWKPQIQEETPSLNMFLRKKALELDLPLPSRKQRLEGWRPQGTLVAEIPEHNDAVTCLVAASSTYFVSGSSDGTVRVFDANAFRRNAVCRSKASVVQGGRITALAFQPVMGCVASGSDNGSILLHKAKTLTQLSETVLDDGGEYPIAMGFAKTLEGVSLIVATSSSRVLFLDAATLALQNSVQLKPMYGRLTSLAVGGSFAIVGTSAGLLVLIDTRFRIEVKTYRHFMGHPVTCLTMFKPETLLVGTAAGDICALDLRNNTWPVCVCARSLQDVKSDVIKRSACVNAIAHSSGLPYFVSAGNDAVVRYWDLERLDRSFAVSGANVSPPPPYASYRGDGTVYYCENAAPKRKPMDGVQQAVVPEGSGPVTAVALVSSPVAMVVAGLQSGCIRVLL